MSEEIEIEFKNLLTEKEYQTLLYSFNATENELFTQINSYFDTPDWDLKNYMLACESVYCLILLS